MTRRSRSPKPQLRAAEGCWRTVMRYSEVGDRIAGGIGALLFPLSELRRLEMLIDLASCLGDALLMLGGGLCGRTEAGRPLGAEEYGGCDILLCGCVVS